jgi:hypothetical protein
MIVLVKSNEEDAVNMCCFNFEHSVLYIKKCSNSDGIERYLLMAELGNDNSYICGYYSSRINAETSLLEITQAYLNGKSHFCVLTDEDVKKLNKREINNNE